MTLVTSFNPKIIWQGNYYILTGDIEVITDTVNSMIEQGFIPGWGELMDGGKCAQMVWRDFTAYDLDSGV